jgi:hypothetical protein
MQTVTTIGLDIAKSVFQVHGVDAEGNVLRLSRSSLSTPEWLMKPMLPSGRSSERCMSV